VAYSLNVSHLSVFMQFSPVCIIRNRARKRTGSLRISAAGSSIAEIARERQVQEQRAEEI